MTDDKSYNIRCPSCIKKKIHTKADTTRYHPYAGHGYSGEHGQKKWTHQDLAKEKEKDNEKRAKANM